MIGGFMVSSNEEGEYGCLLSSTVVLVEALHVAIFHGHSHAVQILRVTDSLTNNQERLTVKER